MVLGNPPMAMKLQKHVLEHISLKAKEQAQFLAMQGQPSIRSIWPLL